MHEQSTSPNGKTAVTAAVQPSKPLVFRLGASGNIPNNPQLPLIIYPAAIKLDIHIAQVPLPELDPVFGVSGSVPALWRKTAASQD